MQVSAKIQGCLARGDSHHERGDWVSFAEQYKKLLNILLMSSTRPGLIRQTSTLEFKHEDFNTFDHALGIIGRH